MTNFYSLDELDKIKHVQYHIIFGERSNGKSYCLGKRVLDNFFKRGEQFVICKRYEEDMKTKICGTMLSPLYDYVEEEYGYKIKFYQGSWWAYPLGTDGKMSECECIGYALAINVCDRLKGSQYPKVKTIIFEEFMSQSASYLVDEVNLFINLVSTIVRNRTDVKIYLLGNAICKHSPYSDALDIRLHRMKKGEIIVKEYQDKKNRRTKFAIQRTENVDVFDTDENTEGVVYNVFGNSGVGNMITTGDFETHKYNIDSCGVTFSECLAELPPYKYTIVSKKHRTEVIIRYEDYFYAIYRVQVGQQVVFAFREIERDKISEKHFSYIMNNKEHFPYLTNINNMLSYTDGYIDWLLDEMVHSFKQDKYIFLSNDNGEDVNCALTLIK